MPVERVLCAAGVLVFPEYYALLSLKTVKNSSFLAGAYILADSNILLLFGVAGLYKQVRRVREAFRPNKLAGSL